MLSCFCLPGPLRRVCYDTYANDAYDDYRGYGLGSGRTGGSDSVHRDAVWIMDKEAKRHYGGLRTENQAPGNDVLGNPGGGWKNQAATAMPFGWSRS